MQRASILCGSGWLLALALTPLGRADEPINFSRDIRPILSNNCFHCHGPDPATREADLRLDLEADAFADRDGAPAIKPGDLAGSLVWERITTDDEDLRMPPLDSHKTLTPAQIEQLKRWIEQGAQWEGHWAFTAPVAPPLPTPQTADWGHNAIDAFVLARLEQAGLKPSPESDRETLIRRVTFDLTGLPPTLAEIDAFVKDTSPEAYEKVVDRLLASPHYGERMALAWMDAARYGDSSVFHADGPRDMWGWRDWVINAYNANMPFSQFTVDQVAGDLAPNATVAQKVASGFNRNHGTTDEGGAIAEEYRVEYVIDRVKTTSTVWLGLTMECAQCHDHKYDPISQKEYYQFFAYFNQTTDGGMQTRNGNAAPLVQVTDPANEALAAAERQKITDLEAQKQARVAAIEPTFDAWQKSMTATQGGAPPYPAEPLVHLPLDETEGAIVTDAAHQRPAKFVGPPAYAAGKLAGAAQLKGDNYVDLGDLANFDRDQAFSYGAWINLADGGHGAVLARMDDGQAHRGYDLYLAGGKVAVHLIHDWPTNAIKVTTKAAIKPNAWQHVFVTYDGSSKAAGVKIYFDGKLQPWDIERDSLSDTIRGAAPLLIGRRSPGSPFKGLVDEVRFYARALSETDVALLAGADPLQPILAVDPAARTPEQLATLRQHYLNNVDAEYPRLTAELAACHAKIAELSKPLTSVMIMQEMPKPRATYVLNRGDYASPIKEEVITPGVPAAFPPLPADAPANRWGLAQWLVDPQNPLTSRVAVNRYWSMFFGAGLVSTVEDFGAQGDWPSHPELLDWLAVDFMQHGWDTKRAIKQMLMSATYRQSARLTPELAEQDPQNLLLSRGPRFRLQGEFIRDQALAVSGLLVEKIGGPSVKPYEPPGLWAEVALGGNAKYVQDHGDKLYRRSMYTYWKRSAPSPAMRAFDAPTREKCVVQRQRTNTPLQALVTLNDPQFVEAARALAQRMIVEGGASPEERIRFAYRLATGQAPSDKTVALLRAAYERELAVFTTDAQRAESLLKVGESPRDAQLDAAEHAAWTVVASLLLNLDLTLTRG